MDEVVVVAQLFSMLAAFASVVFAYAAVLETQALRREERIARLLELVAEVGESGTRAARGQAGENLLTVARHRLRAAVMAVGEPLPECERLLAVDWPSYGQRSDAAEREAEAFAAVDAELNEVATVLTRLRRTGSTVTP